MKDEYVGKNCRFAGFRQQDERRAALSLRDQQPFITGNQAANAPKQEAQDPDPDAGPIQVRFLNAPLTHTHTHSS